MKAIFLVIVLALLFPSRVWSATITAVGNGNWSTNSVWSCNCQPTSSDNIVIPAGRTVTANGPVILFLGPVINITIGGTLILNNASLQIDASDVVNILNGGKITGSGILGGAVYSGVTPIFVSSGSTINGPKTISNGLLPIRLVYFRSSTVNDGILLEWKSSEEINFDYYDIARSDDGKSFTSFATVISRDRNGAEYTLVDASPFEGTTYYKLTAVDLDGSREEMELIKSEWNGFRDWISVYPNPVTDGTIHALFFGGGKGSFRLLDCNGGVVAETSFRNAVACDLRLPATVGPGVYFVHAQVDGRAAQIKIIIK